MAQSLYDVLGISPATSTEQVHRAYLERARRLHPDRWMDASERERGDAARRMQEVNEAWRILGDAGRRRTYDESLRAAPHAADVATTRDHDVADGHLDPVVRLIRALPWLVLLAVLAAIFVFTAYAGTPR